MARNFRASPLRQRPLCRHGLASRSISRRPTSFKVASFRQRTSFCPARTQTRVALPSPSRAAVMPCSHFQAQRRQSVRWLKRSRVAIPLLAAIGSMPQQIARAGGQNERRSSLLRLHLRLQRRLISGYSLPAKQQRRMGWRRPLWDGKAASHSQCLHGTYPPCRVGRHSAEVLPS